LAWVGRGRLTEPLPLALLLVLLLLQKLVKANGGVRPEAVLKTKQRNPAPADEAGRQADGESTDGAESSAMRVEAQERGEEEEHSDSWETASEDEEDFEPWDPCVSLFDNHKSKNVEDNIEYMWKNFGFSIPDVEYLADPEGLIVYLGAKVGQGFIPLYSSGLDPEAKTFGSVHAVQRHMVDTGKTRMLYEDNEEEYEDFYDYSAMEAALEERMGSLQLAESSSVGQVAVSNGYELFLPKKGKTSKVLGSRSLSKYYKQSHRPLDQRQSVLANKIVARYRMLGLLKHEDAIKNLAVMNDSENKRRDHQMELKLHSGIQNAVINKLPRNVPY